MLWAAIAINIWRTFFIFFTFVVYKITAYDLRIALGTNTIAQFLQDGDDVKEQCSYPVRI